MSFVPSLSALLGAASLCAITVFGFRADTIAPPQDKPKNGDPPTYTGMIGECWVAAPGRVQFQLIGSGAHIKDGKHPDLWFDTPADKDLNTLFEDLTLDLVLHAHEKGLPIVVEAKNSSGDDGTTAAKAFDVIRVGLGKT